MSCVACNGTGRISLPNPAWRIETPREALGAAGCHGRPVRTCEPCEGTGQR